VTEERPGPDWLMTVAPNGDGYADLLLSLRRHGDSAGETGIQRCLHVLATSDGGFHELITRSASLTREGPPPGLIGYMNGDPLAGPGRSAIVSYDRSSRS
jgi:hypothetical protein